MLSRNSSPCAPRVECSIRCDKVACHHLQEVDEAAYRLQQAVGTATAMSDEVTSLRWRMAQSELAMTRLEGEITNGVAASKVAALERLKTNLDRATLSVEEVCDTGTILWCADSPV